MNWWTDHSTDKMRREVFSSQEASSFFSPEAVRLTTDSRRFSSLNSSTSSCGDKGVDENPHENREESREERLQDARTTSLRSIGEAERMESDERGAAGLGAFVGEVVDIAGLLSAYPGPAIRASANRKIVAVNVIARKLMIGDRLWWRQAVDWLGIDVSGPSSPFVARIETANGQVMIEWVAAPLPEGDWLLFGRDVTLDYQLRQALTESRQRYKDLVEISSDFAWETGADGRFSFVSPFGALGFPSERLIGRPPAEFVVDARDDMCLPFTTLRSIEQAEVWVRTADGHAACVAVSAAPLIGPDGSWRGARGVCRNVTDQIMRAAELARVRNREQLLSHIVLTLRDRLDPNEALVVAAAEVTRALSADGCRIFRMEECDRLTVVTEFGASPPLDMDVLVRELAGASGPMSSDMSEVRVLGCRTQYRHIVNGALCVWRGGQSEAWDEEDGLLIAGVADHLGIAHVHLAYQEGLRHMSERDGLTGLFNRRTFFDRLSEQLQQNDRGTSALLYVDLDNFKAVNDRYGHQRGDAVLRTVGKLLTCGVRPGDLPGRLGGDEFVLWLARSDAEAAIRVSERLLSGMSELQSFSAGPDLLLGMSIGIAIHEPRRFSSTEKHVELETAQSLIDRADAAMYQAKQRGKGNYAVASSMFREGMAAGDSKAEPAVGVEMWRSKTGAAATTGGDGHASCG
ncbi:PAS domain S-box-containing protein/diguanylate cyclase (GGDEF)-like protein [Azospirillaceae bacterium]